MTAPSTMKAARWTSTPIEASIKIEQQFPRPKGKLPKQSELVKVEYVSLNPVDYKVPEFAMAKLAGIGKITGSDFAGTVVESNLDHVTVGDRVAGLTKLPAFGTLAEYVVVTGGEHISKVPTGVDLSDAATIGVAGITALQCLKPCAKSGDRVIIRGASGGTGVFGIQIAKLLGCHVTAVCSGGNAELCKDLGADEVIDYKSVDFVKELGNAGPLCDLLIDNVSVGGTALSQSRTFLKPSGQYLSIAGAPSLSTVAGAYQLFAPSWLGGAPRKASLVVCQPNREDLTQLLGWVQDGKLKPVVEKIYEFCDAARAFQRLKTGRTRGKLVVKVA